MQADLFYWDGLLIRLYFFEIALRTPLKGNM